MSDTTMITFPSASNQSKLSACPTTKIPQATDWIFQDFFHTMMMDGNQDQHVSPSIQISELFPQEKYFMSSCSDEWPVECPDLDNSKSDDDDELEEAMDRGVTSDFSTWMNVAPVLIESNISSCTTESTEEVTSFRDDMDDDRYTTAATYLKKKRSTSSFGSLKSVIGVFNNHHSKKTKLHHHPSVVVETVATKSPQKVSITASISKKVLNYFKRRL